ncbi:hypothetical protein HOF92_04435 [bacterium]|nr:hypothetical protein [bacterium]
MNSKKWISILPLFLALSILPGQEVQATDVPSDGSETAQRKKSKTKHRFQKLLRKVKSENPELFQNFQDSRGTWRDLSPEQRREARQNWIETTPGAKAYFQKSLVKKARKDRVERLKSENPELFDHLKQARESWKDLDKKERREARREFVEKNPKVKQLFHRKKDRQERKKKIKALKTQNPDLFKLLKEKRKSMKDLSTEEKRKARKELVEAHPELRDILLGRKRGNRRDRKTNL